MPKQCRQAPIILVQKALIGHIKGRFRKLRENTCDQKDPDNELFVFVLVDPMSQDFEPLLYPIPDRGHLKSPRSSFSRLSTSIRYTISSTVSLTWIKNNSYAFGRALQVYTTTLTKEKRGGIRHGHRLSSFRKHLLGTYRCYGVGGEYGSYGYGGSYTVNKPSSVSAFSNTNSTLSFHQSMKSATCSSVAVPSAILNPFPTTI